MTNIQGIARDVVLSDPVSVELAAVKMHAVTDHELHFYLVMRDTLSATAQETRKCITLAQVEWDRRLAVRARRLAFLTTFFSGLVGLLGVALGAYLSQ